MGKPEAQAAPKPATDEIARLQWANSDLRRDLVKKNRRIEELVSEIAALKSRHAQN